MLIGRQGQIAEVARALGRPGLVLLTGPAGIGKSAVASAGAQEAKRRLLIGGGLRALSEVPGVALGRAVGGRLPIHDPVLAAEAVRLRVGDGVLLLDDAQWADRFSLLVVRQLALRTRVVVCVRTLTPGARRLVERLADGARLALDLPALDDADAAELVRQSSSGRSPGDGPDWLADVVRRAGGNPLALAQLARSDGGGSLRQAVAATLAEMSQGARTALAAIGAVGRSVPESLIGQAAGELIGARLIRAAEGGQVAATEPAIAELAFALLPAEQRAALHGRVARTLPDAEAATHYAEAGLLEEAIAAARRGAEVAIDEGTRIRLLLLAVRLAGDRSSADERHELATRALGVEDLAAVAELLEMPSGLTEPERVDRAVLRAELALARGDGPAALAELAQVDEPDPPPARYALARATVLLADDAVLAVSAAREVLALVEPDDPTTAAQAQVVLGLALLRLGESGWADLFSQAANSAEQAGAWVVRCRAVLAHAGGLLEVGRPVEAAALAASFAEECRRRHNLTWSLRCQAVTLWARLHVRGELDAVADVGAGVLGGAAPRDVIEQVAALVALALGDAGNPHAGRRLLEAHQAQTRLAEWTAAELALLSGDYGLAEIAARGLGSPADLAGRLGLLTAGFAAYASEALPVPEVAGLDRTADDWQYAAQQWQDVMRREQVRAYWAAGALTAAVDSAQGLKMLLEAYRSAGQAGLLSLQSLIGTAVRRAGGSLPAVRSGSDGRPTTRERQVLDLVAEGLSSRAIATQLGLSVLTVDSHVKSAMTTLGAPTRLAAALRARELE